jgi:hypothetical protein
MKIRHEITEILRNGGKEIQFLLPLKFITKFIFHVSYCLFTPSLFLYLCELQASSCYRRFLVKNKLYPLREKKMSTVRNSNVS